MDEKKWISLSVNEGIWEQVHTVSPLVLIGTKEGEDYDLAPKHMAMPLGLNDYFGFICTPDHATYHNVKRERFFTVSYPRAEQIVLSSLAAMPRKGGAGGKKEIVDMLPTLPAEQGDALLLRDAYLYIECELDRVIDGFGRHSLIAGRILAARVHPDFYLGSEVDQQQMLQKAPLPVYLHPSRFSRISESLAFPFPKDFNR